MICTHKIKKRSRRAAPFKNSLSTDKIRPLAALGGGDFHTGGLAGLDALQQPGHVGAQVAHDLAAFLVQGHLIAAGAVDHRPVGGADQRHLVELRDLFHSLNGGGGAGAACAGHDGRRFVPQISPGAVGQPVHKAQHAARRRGIVYRRTKHDAVGLFHQWQHIHHRPAEHTVPGLGAAAAAYTAAHRRGADVVDRRLNARGVQRFGNLTQGMVGAALLVGAAVDQQYVHTKSLRLYNMRHTPQKML